jgi:hypothetical protein
MKRLKVHLFSCVLAAVLIALLLPPAAAEAAAWSVVPSPSPGALGNELNGVASVSASDVWAVGEFTNAFPGQTLTEHWNGSAWKVVKSPNAPSGNNNLLAVSTVSSKDVWAVGFFQAASGSPRLTLTEHWNGHKWSVVPSPSPAGADNILLAVAAVSRTDVWAVGSFVVSGFGPSRTLIEHWDGRTWSVVPSPNASTQNNELNGVTAVSASDIWAVGDFLPSASSATQTLIEHWNGTSWSVVPSPNASTGFNTLAATAAVSAGDVWAVGRFLSATGTGQTLAEHWNGSSWSVVASPNVGTDNGLKGVAIISATDIWAAGFTVTNFVNQTLIEQWNGTSWSVVPSPSPSTVFNILNAAAADKSSGQAWAVGDFSNAAQHLQTLTEFNP